MDNVYKCLYCGTMFSKQIEVEKSNLSSPANSNLSISPLPQQHINVNMQVPTMESSTSVNEHNRNQRSKTIAGLLAIF